jgi:protein-disulfide isomerase
MVLLVGLLAVAPGLARADATNELFEDRVMGAAEAPVTIVEYSSLTCSHCANFHTDTLPKIKETYMDTGKVRLVFRDFPFEQRGMTAAMVARCVSPERFFGFLDVLFRTQDKWANDPHFLDELLRYGRMGGLSEEAFNACLGNQKLLDVILARQEVAKKKFEISSTPTFIINGEMVNGARPFEEFKKIIDSKLK